MMPQAWSDLFRSLTIFNNCLPAIIAKTHNQRATYIDKKTFGLHLN